MKVGISPRARFDLIDIQDFIARDNPWRAESFVEELFAKFAAIGERPLSFPVWHPKFPDVRSARHGRYLILFRVEGKRPRIDRVLHGARDILGLLGDGA